MQVDTFVSPVVIDALDAGCRNLQFYFFNPAAVEQPIGKQKQKTAASAGFARLRGSSKKINTKTHRQNRPAAETLVDPFTVAPAHPGNIADDPEKDDRNDNPLLIA